jgi:dihydrofolate synthase/folylpolyglutamate synthase
VGNPERCYPVIHVGGTNGKGSVATLVAETLQRAGRRVALYTSPHLVDVRERMVVDGRPISRDAFAVWTDMLRPAIEQTGASFFEATTAMAFADFAARGAEVAVIEVGLGGRLDSTNVVMPLVCAVVTVGMEHTEYLGDTLEGIAREKAGIAKAGRPFVIGERDPTIATLLVSFATAAGATPTVVPPECLYDGSLALAGAHQRRNAAVAAAVLDALPGELRPSSAVRSKTFASVVVPGRFDRRGRWLFDVAHNPSGIEALIAGLHEVDLPRPIHVLAGVLADKDWRTMLARLDAAVDRMWITTPPTAPPERRWPLQEVGAAFPDAVVAPEFDRALHDVQDGAATIVVTGSFHTVGDAMARLPSFAPLG